MQDKPIRLVELFAGYGSQALALKRLGLKFEHYKVIEFDKYAIKSYNAIHNTDFKPIDIRDVKGSDLNIVDTEKFSYCLTYSFPCTDLSNAGKGLGMSRGSGTRSGLLWEVERLLRDLNEAQNLCLPQVLVMENVPQVHGEKNISDFAEWITFLDSLGYISKWQDLNAKNYGVPQNRERCFMVSYLDRGLKFAFPESKPLEKVAKDCLEKNVKTTYFIKPDKQKEILEQIKNKEDIKTQALIDLTTNEPQINIIANCITAHPNSIKTHVKEGNGVVKKEEHNYRVRKLTPLECLRFMDIDDSDALKMLSVNSEAQIYKQAGNSIVVAVLAEIFKNIYLGGSEKVKAQIDIFDILE